MYFLALAADYDGTLAHDGVVSAGTLESLRRLKQSGRHLLLVTGRELPDLKHLLPDLSLFDRVVAENGALLYVPATGEERLLASPPPEALVQRLAERGVGPISAGRVVVATWEPHQAQVVETIRELGLELQIVFNKGAIMILPPGVNKASGLLAALHDLRLSPQNAVAVGDAENDHALLRASGCAAAVANAVEALKADADIVLTRDHGDGVSELVDALIAADALIAPRAKHGLHLGHGPGGEEIVLEPWQGSVLIAGPSGCGKSTLATALTEKMTERCFEFCVIDPEGDYPGLEHTVGVGDARTAPVLGDAISLLRNAEVNLVINTQAMGLGARRHLLAALFEETASLKAETGRPHWVIIDEAHQVLPAGSEIDLPGKAGDIPSSIFITLDPAAMAHPILRSVHVVLAFGSAAPHILRSMAQALGIEAPEVSAPEAGCLLWWSPWSGDPPVTVRLSIPEQCHKRHAGKYAAGDVGAERSFWFRGPHKEMNIRARNLYEFLDIADGVSDAVWLHHLQAGDYSAWFRHVIKDTTLAVQAAAIEARHRLSASESRRLIGKAIRRHYAAPAESLSER
ncbi:HAD family hydrolase [Radicibacter daui]|uniref:HAD family hydrolase n=1 Tax=Radicibacter daui TaxID=3064829 RepID=UPI004046A927